MQHASIIIKKLKSFLNIKTDLELAEILDVKPNTISSWKKRNSLQFETIIGLCKEHKIDLNELFYSDYTLFKAQKNKNSKEVKLISSELHFQYLLDPEKTLAQLPYYNFPFIEDVEIGFQVISENMTPSIRVSSFAICKPTTIDQIISLEIYVLILKNKGLFVMRFKKITPDGQLMFVSDNSTFDATLIDREDIKSIFVVKGAFLPCFRGLTS